MFGASESSYNFRRECSCQESPTGRRGNDSSPVMECHILFNHIVVSHSVKTCFKVALDEHILRTILRYNTIFG